MVVKLSTGERVIFTNHSIDRYNQRLNLSCFGEEQTKKRIKDICSSVGAISKARPEWAVRFKNPVDNSYWLVFGPDVAFLLEKENRSKPYYRAKTCITKGYERKND